MFISSDEIIGCRNQDNDFLDSIGKIKPRDNDEDEVSPGKLVISHDIDAHEIGFSIYYLNGI